ncbi:menaquinol-cytochrome c reductase cytochrome b/c subunit [Bacillus sp. Marseille-P3661]|uniref:menaquinol-cytochrome c reductase cytochrome b/c subunit n=1 Tax=Bacillus sp. Marseille-P3661 TaxID=1936234 RepID=UPI000C818AC1|nr:menaquinol-cytochrome c reductase cytochrome b/c subunit [Bacillus sp. Marseille-P3661]
MHRGKGMKFVGDSRVPAERKPNIPKDYSEYPGKTEAFWPNFLLKEWMVGAVFLMGYLSLTIAHPSPLERVADPTDTSYLPLPDWYFLFLYQLLKYEFASGPYTVIGALIIPGLAFGSLLLAPWLDRGPGRRPSQRPVAVGLMLVAIAATTYLTWESAVHVDWEAKAESAKIVETVEFDKADPGYAAMETSGCLSCHGTELTGGPAAPSLVGTGLTPDEIANIAVNGQGTMPPGMFKGSDEELQQLAEFISALGTK